MRKLIFWGTIASGAIAAYMMYKRGEKLGSIALHTATNPLGSLVTELRRA